MYRTVATLIIGVMACVSAPAEEKGWITITGVKSQVPTDQTILTLRGKKVTDSVLKELAPLKKLAELEMKNLHWLDLKNSKISDAGLKDLAALKNLITLNLSHTKVTDAGLMELAALENLTSLDLIGTKVTFPGLRRFKAARPGCSVYNELGLNP